MTVECPKQKCWTACNLQNNVCPNNSGSVTEPLFIHILVAYQSTEQHLESTSRGQQARQHQVCALVLYILHHKILFALRIHVQQK